VDPFVGQRWTEVWPERVAWHLFTVGVLGVLLLILLVSVRSLGEPIPPPGAAAAGAGQAAVPVRVEAVRAERPVSRVRLPGVVEPLARIELGFRVDGQIERYHVLEGQRVEAGEIIADLLRDDLERDVRIARAAASRARAQSGDAASKSKRQNVLLAGKSTSRERVDDARLAHDVASAEVLEAELQLAAAEARLAKASLRAPFAGVIERQLVEAHERTNVHSPVVILTDLSRVRVRGAAPDRLISQLLAGTQAEVRSQAWPERIFVGHIVQIDVGVDPATRTVPFEVEIDNADFALRPELAVEIELQLGEAEERPSLPMAAVLRDSDRQPFCFVAESGLGDSTQAIRRDLSLGRVMRDRVTILAGLSPGERVVVRGQHFVHAGDTLDVLEFAANAKD
jgi:membrane fusion protein (multidrug efflux system)